MGAGGEGDNRGWDGWIASLTRWTWVWVNSGSWWWTGRPGVLRFMGSQKSRTGLSDWTELNWLNTMLLIWGYFLQLLVFDNTQSFSFTKIAGLFYNALVQDCISKPLVYNENSSYITSHSFCIWSCSALFYL